MKVQICLSGCDDYTVFEIDTTEEEYLFLEKISKLSKETSTYGCMPTLLIEKII